MVTEAVLEMLIVVAFGLIIASIVLVLFILIGLLCAYFVGGKDLARTYWVAVNRPDDPPDPMVRYCEGWTG